MKPKEYPAGTKFNNWTIIKEVKSLTSRKFLCINSYGEKKEVILKHLKSGASKGYYNKGKFNANFKHGISKTRPWLVWQGLKRRCNNKNEPGYKNYGGRGITYDPRWNKFENFWEDMKDGYSDQLSIDRIDNNGNYCKNNCRWATREVQSNNKRTTVYIKYKGKRYALMQVAKIIGVNYHTLYGRIFEYKIPLKKALTSKILKSGPKF